MAALLLREGEVPEGGALTKKPERDRTVSEDHMPTEDILAAFDREWAEAQELNRRHTEQVRNSRADDQPVRIERRRKPR
jgi:hypothetical protein